MDDNIHSEQGERISHWLNEQLFSIIDSSLENSDSNLSEEVKIILTNVG